MKLITRHYSLRLCFFISLCSLAACVPHDPALSSFSKSNAVHSTSFSFFNNLRARKRPSKQIKSPNTYVVRGQKYTTLKSARGYKARGLASWYSAGLHNQRTSSGERYNMNALTAAHRTLPLQTYLQVKNLKNGRTVIVRVNDRGPFHSNRVVDLSYAAAKQLGLFPAGMVMVEVQTINPGFFQRQTVIKAKPEPRIAPKARQKPKSRTRARPAVSASSMIKLKSKSHTASKIKSTPKIKPKMIAKPKPIVKAKRVSKSKIVKPKPRIKTKSIPKTKLKTPVKPSIKPKSQFKPSHKTRVN